MLPARFQYASGPVWVLILGFARERSMSGEPTLPGFVPAHGVPPVTEQPGTAHGGLPVEQLMSEREGMCLCIPFTIPPTLVRVVTSSRALEKIT